MVQPLEAAEIKFNAGCVPVTHPEPVKGDESTVTSPVATDRTSVNVR